MTGHYIAHDAKGYQVWRLVNGLYRQNVGPHFPEPRAAMAYADTLDAAFDISPLPATSEAHDPRDTPRSSRALRGSPDAPPSQRPASAG